MNLENSIQKKMTLMLMLMLCTNVLILSQTLDLLHYRKESKN